MNIQRIAIGQIKPNPTNPRVIKDHKFKQLVKSIQEFPQMLDIRPIVVNADMVVLGGNMRLKACREAGLKELPVLIAEHLTEQQQKEFIIKDNNSFGEWDWDALANTWDTAELSDWGVDVWHNPTGVDYTMLDNDDVEKQIDDMGEGVRKAIQIEFLPDDYEQAVELVKQARDRGDYVGGILMKALIDTL